MKVPLCATRGTRLTEPVRQLDEMPGYPGRDGLPGPDGRRHGPASVPRGTYIVDPQPFGAPFEPTGPDEEYDGVVPGGMWMSDDRGSLVTAGPRNTHVPHPDDIVGITPRPDPYRLVGCCGPDGRAGVDHVCTCRADMAIAAADRTSRYETRLVRDAVRVAAAE